MALIRKVDKTAPQKLISIWGKKLIVRKIIAMLIRMVKSPILSMISGSEKIKTSGLTKELTKEKIRPAAR